MNSQTQSPSAPVVNVLRWLVELIAIVVLGRWGFTAFAFPWPAIATGLGAPAFALIVWAVFLSPRAVLSVDQFGTALVEIILFSAAALAMLFMGWPWWASVALIVLGTVAGILAGRQQLR